MSYNKKIQIIEANIAELDMELKIVSSRLEENIDTLNSLLENIEDKQKSQKEEGDSNWKSEHKIINENIKISIAILKKSSHLQLEKYRLQSNIIKKISSNTSKFLDLKINELETVMLQSLKSFDNWEKSGADGKDERHKLVKELNDKARLINEFVRISNNCIKDTLDKIKN